MRPGWPIVLGFSVALAGVGCSAGSTPATPAAFDETHSDLTVAEARAARSVPLFWVGASFEGLPLVAILGSSDDGASFVYGTCEPPPGAEGGCSPPLVIQTLRMCPPTTRTRPLSQRRVLRGVPAGSRGGATVLPSRKVEIRVFADGGQGRRAIAEMGAVNPAAPGAVGPAKPLPAPTAGAERRVPCSVVR